MLGALVALSRQDEKDDERLSAIKSAAKVVAVRPAAS